mgnify:CR=1 FL=1
MPRSIIDSIHMPEDTPTLEYESQRTSAQRPGTIRIVIADDHPLFREALRGVLAGSPGLVVVGEAGDGEEALALFSDSTDRPGPATARSSTSPSDAPHREGRPVAMTDLFDLSGRVALVTGSARGIVSMRAHTCFIPSIRAGAVPGSANARYVIS